MLKDLIKFVRNIKSAYIDWKEQQKHFHDETGLAYELDDIGLSGDVAYNLGSAIELANTLGIELHKGLSFGDCRAILPRANWQNYDRDPESNFVYGQFLMKPFKDVTEIQMLDTDICFAIAKCALMAKRAGVI